MRIKLDEKYFWYLFKTPSFSRSSNAGCGENIPVGGNLSYHGIFDKLSSPENCCFEN